MAPMHTLPLFLTLGLLSSFTSASNFNVVNNCSYTVWAAASPGGGRRLDPGQSWSFDVAAGTTGGRIWGRTNCSFDANGRGSCTSGDCSGLLECKGYGSPPNTLAEFALNQFNEDFYDISLTDGFNIPMDFSPISGRCGRVRCAGTRILDECPAQLKAPGGCNNPCTVYKTNEYCCTQGQAGCGSNDLIRFFKERCPDAYPPPDSASTTVCPAGTNYRVTFCP